MWTYCLDPTVHGVVLEGSKIMPSILAMNMMKVSGLPTGILKHNTVASGTNEAFNRCQRAFLPDISHQNGHNAVWDMKNIAYLNISDQPTRLTRRYTWQVSQTRTIASDFFPISIRVKIRYILISVKKIKCCIQCCGAAQNWDLFGWSMHSFLSPS